MKKLITFILLIVTISVSAQKVTRKDLNRLLLKGDTSRIIDDGFVYAGVDDGLTSYIRYDSTEVITFDKDGVYYVAANVFHMYSGITEMTPKGDLMWNVNENKYKAYYLEDEDGNVTDSWSEYEMSETILECRSIKFSGEESFEFFLYRK
jgi:hypothetical protein